MEIKFSDRLEAACFHLRYKIDKNLDGLSKLGLMSTEEVSSHILRNIYPTEDVEGAINEALKTEHLNVYYSVECDMCDKNSLFLEGNFQTRETWHLLFKEGERCQHCGRKVIANVKNTSKLFAVSNFKLQTNSEADIEEKTTFQRMISWLLPKRKQK